MGHAVQSTTETRLELLNASRRKVIITFSPDPDISTFEEISARTLKNVIAIEVKGGADKSNIWNRLGEAEKSHQSAKQRGFVEFWTIYNVPSLDLAKAREKSPTTNRFYSLINSPPRPPRNLPTSATAWLLSSELPRKPSDPSEGGSPITDY